MNLVPSPMCTFCGDHEETLEHLLVSCAYTKIFWLSVISWLITYNMKIDKLDEVTILFGIFDNNRELFTKSFNHSWEIYHLFMPL